LRGAQDREPARAVRAALIEIAYLAATARNRGAHDPEELPMSVHVALQPLIALIAGILILIVPRLLNYVVAIYLIIVGIIGLAPMLHM
jgi:hypothetical protein